MYSPKVELTLGSLLCLCSLCLSSLGRVQLLVVGCPGSLVVGVCLLLALGSGSDSSLLVGVLAAPGSSRGGASRSSVHGSLWGSKHLGSLVGTAADRHTHTVGNNHDMHPYQVKNPVQ